MPPLSEICIHISDARSRDSAVRAWWGRHATLEPGCRSSAGDACRINRSPFKADHVIELRRGAAACSAWMTIKGNRKNRVRQVSGAS